MYQYTTEEKNKLLEHENSILKKELAAHQEEAVQHFITREEMKETIRKVMAIAKTLSECGDPKPWRIDEWRKAQSDLRHNSKG